MEINQYTLITFAIYLIGMLLIGWMAYRMTSNLSDYVLGGRRLNPGVAALSAGASDMSGWLLLGLPGAIYAYGLNQVWIGIGLTIGAYLNWRFVAKRLRIYTEVAQDSITIPDYFENRFYDNSKLLRVLSAIVILVFFTIYTSSGLVGGAILFEKSFGLDYHVALWIGAIVIISYTFLGGFLAVSWTDFFQGILMFLAILIVPIVAIDQLGGYTDLVGRIENINPAYMDIFADMSVIKLLSLLAWGLGYFGQPHIITRFMAVRSESEIPVARRIGMSWMIFSLFGAVLTGFAGIAYFADNPLENSETIFINFTQVLFNPWISGILLAAILAAIMSTVDSQLLVSSSALAEDFYKSILRKNASQKELVLVSRIAVIMISLLAIYLASDPNRKVLELVSYAWAGFGATFGPLIVLSLFWQRVTRNGALIGMIMGATSVVLWKQIANGLFSLELILPANIFRIFELYEIVPGFILSLLTIVIVSLLDKKPSDKIINEYKIVTERYNTNSPS